MFGMVGRLLAKGANALRALDVLLMDAAEAGYLWLYDRTGVPKAAILMISMYLSILYMHANGLFDLPTTVVCLGAFGAGGIWMLYVESFRTRDANNAEVEALRSGAIRQLCFPAISIFAVVAASQDILIGKGQTSPLFFIPIVMYVLLARTRDRKPPRRKVRGAGVGAEGA